MAKPHQYPRLTIDDSRAIQLWIFAIISIIYIATRELIFKGFNGTDDLHYAMLASRMIKGTYSPFVKGDIFSGRVLLIAWQALVYRIGGINVFTTKATTIFAIVLACYLTVFKLLKANTTSLVIVASSLFYFNPTLTTATNGILPDIYVVLAGITVLILWDRSVTQLRTRKNLLYGVYMGFTVAAYLFVKETVMLFFVLIACLAGVYRNRQAVVTAMAMAATLLMCGAIIGVWYYYNTGDVFFRLIQVSNSYYYNPCSYDIIPVSFIIERLTYGPWREFIRYGFYPVIFAAALIVYNLFLYKPLAIFKDPFILCFFILLLAGLYFPFSIKGYQPLCGDIRHFLFLLPLGVFAVSRYIDTNISNSKTIKWAVISFIALVCCVISTPDKWQWMEWSLFIVYFIMIKLFANKIMQALKTSAFALLLWMCMPYHLFYGNSNWFDDMRHLDKQLTGTHYYFADHDNMMHWKLLHQFNDSVHAYDMDPSPFKIFQLYYETIDTSAFHPGWFLVNGTYTERSESFLHTVDSLIQKKYFNLQIINGDMRAMYLQQSAQLALVKNLVASDIKVMR